MCNRAWCLPNLAAEMTEDNMTIDKQTAIFFVEDNNTLRYWLKNFISKIADFHLVGESSTGGEATKQILLLKPDIILVDIGLPDIDGIEVVRQTKSKFKDLRALMLTASDNEQDVFNALDAGADGYVLKEDFATNLETAIRSVRLGAAWLDPGIARLVLKRTQISTSKKETSKPKTPVNAQKVNAQKESSNYLSSQEIELLGKVAAADCKDGVCLVDPQFLMKLKRFSNTQGNMT